MDIFLLFLLVVLVAGVGVVIFLLLQKKEDVGGDKLVAVLESLAHVKEQNSQLNTANVELRKMMDSKLSEAHKTNQDQIGKTVGMMQNVNEQTQKALGQVHKESQKIVQEVTEKLVKLDETNKQVVNFSGQLKNLQDILKNPKQRGVLGEYYLEETLKNVLPPSNYQMQYSFKDGTIVDAVVFVKEKIIPIDSKFSLENYERLLDCSDEVERERLEKSFKMDLKTRIDETAKYVKPGENTMDFAFMFIPSESIYYDLLVNKVGAAKVNMRDLIDYAFKEKKVIIVSPTSFLAYLQTVLQGLRALQIEDNAKFIRHEVEKLGKHLLRYEDFMQKIGNSMGTTVNHYNNAYKEFKKVDKDIAKITEGKSEMEPIVLDKPIIDN